MAEFSTKMLSQQIRLLISYPEIEMITIRSGYFSKFLQFILSHIPSDIYSLTKGFFG